MKNIQLILLTMIVLGTLLYFSRMRSRLFDWMLVLLFSATAVAVVSAPELTVWLAAELGVGRGVDVVIYFLAVFLCFLGLQLHARLREQEARLAQLARWIVADHHQVADEAGDVLPADRARVPLPISPDTRWIPARNIAALKEPIQSFVEVP